ncbi:MAG TPA: formyltetrahydrofolate deformylase [Trueperaceae bacterium]|nr:formyltetrahydrofolate deformylase [Trueperaceae bacterium]
MAERSDPQRRPDTGGPPAPGGAPSSTGGRARLLISCPDRPGIVAAVSRFLYERGANITDADQHSSDPHGGTFFMRMAFELAGDAALDALRVAFARDVASRLDMRWRMTDARQGKRIAILASKVEHCLQELLWRRRAGEFEDAIVMVISNHDVLRPVVEGFDVPFHHLPIAPGQGSGAAQETRVLGLLEGAADVVVLARYMQILSPEFVARYPERIINIHHSFLPAFSGGRPYHRAYERGVKLIGATAHYVTDALDQGPIIEQDVVRVTHRHNVPELVRMGREIERRVLARAVKLHLEDRILVHGNKTIVFD